MTQLSCLWTTALQFRLLFFSSPKHRICLCDSQFLSFLPIIPDPSELFVIVIPLLAYITTDLQYDCMGLCAVMFSFVFCGSYTTCVCVHCCFACIISYHYSTEYVCGWVYGLIMHFITFIHDVRSQCGLCAAHHCFHCCFRCFFTASCFCCFFIASCFRCCCVASCFRCRCLSLAILHGWSRQCIFVLCCFLTLFSVAVRNTLCRNSNLLCMPSFLITAQNVCVCVSALILHLFSLSLHNMMRLHLAKVYTMYHCCNCLAGSLRHYVITSLRHYGPLLVSVLCTALSLFSSSLFGSLFFVIHTETRPSQCACVLSAAQCVVLDAMYECGEACYWAVFTCVCTDGDYS